MLFGIVGSIALNIGNKYFMLIENLLKYYPKKYWNSFLNYTLFHAIAKLYIYIYISFLYWSDNSTYFFSKLIVFEILILMILLSSFQS